MAERDCVKIALVNPSCARKVPGTSITLTFSWNISNVPEGNYAIKAMASTVPGETEIVNNEYVNGTITVKLLPVYARPRCTYSQGNLSS